MLKTATAELRVVLAVTGTHTAVGGETVEAAVRGVDDWEAVLDIARVHAVEPALYRHLTALPEGSVPPSVLDTLTEGHRTSLQRGLQLTSELTRVVDRFAGRGVPAIPFKGPVLAQLAYGDVTARRYGDLDFVVRRADVPRVSDALGSLGYELADDSPVDVEDVVAGRSVLHPPTEYHFVRERDNSHVEVRWLFGSTHRPTDYGFDTLRERCCPVSLPGGTVHSLSPADYLVVLARHGAKHCWARLGWVADVAALLRTGTVDWDDVDERAGAAGVDRDVLLAALLVDELTDVTVPEDRLRRARADCRLGALLDVVEARLLTTPTLRSDQIPFDDELAFDLALSAGPQGRARVYLSTALTPTESDYHRLPLPRRLHPLYYLSHPLRVLWTQGHKRRGDTDAPAAQ